MINEGGYETNKKKMISSLQTVQFPYFDVRFVNLTVFNLPFNSIAHANIQSFFGNPIFSFLTFRFVMPDCTQMHVMQLIKFSKLILHFKIMLNLVQTHTQKYQSFNIVRKFMAIMRLKTEVLQRFFFSFCS